MKLLAILLIFLLFFAVLLAVMYVSTEGTEGLAKLFRKRKEESAKWIITPRSSEAGEPEIYLTRGESEEFFLWPTPLNSHLEFDEAMLEAEVQAGEFNRTREQLSQ